MITTTAAAGMCGLELFDPANNTWKVRYNEQANEDGTANYEIKYFDHKPTEKEIRAIFEAEIDSWVEKTILSGMTYKEKMVWLSLENQMNYRNALDLAKKSEDNLPFTVKLGSDDERFYYQITTIDELTTFVDACMMHVHTTRKEAIEKKAAISIEAYK